MNVTVVGGGVVGVCAAYYLARAGARVTVLERAHGVDADGSRRMAPGKVKPFELPAVPTGLMNVTDPDSRVVRTQGQPGM